MNRATVENFRIPGWDIICLKALLSELTAGLEVAVVPFVLGSQQVSNHSIKVLNVSAMVWRHCHLTTLSLDQCVNEASPLLRRRGDVSDSSADKGAHSWWLGLVIAFHTADLRPAEESWSVWHAEHCGVICGWYPAVGPAGGALCSGLVILKIRQQVHTCNLGPPCAQISVYCSDPQNQHHTHSTGAVEYFRVILFHNHQIPWIIHHTEEPQYSVFSLMLY